MSRINALKFLVLQTLNKNKSLISKEIHIEIAKSLDIKLENNSYLVSWVAKGKKSKFSVDEKKFNFYIKSEFEQKSDIDQIETNEKNAKDLILKIVELSL
tara:strand:- start:16701 stop:17000 length:300 start_codon:yes stop_codon:yes gene_type:complete